MRKSEKMEGNPFVLFGQRSYNFHQFWLGRQSKSTADLRLQPAAAIKWQPHIHEYYIAFQRKLKSHTTERNTTGGYANEGYAKERYATEEETNFQKSERRGMSEEADF